MSIQVTRTMTTHDIYTSGYDHDLGRVHTVRGAGCDRGRGLLSSRLVRWSGCDWYAGPMMVRGLLLVIILGGAVGVACYLLSGCGHVCPRVAGDTRCVQVPGHVSPGGHLRPALRRALRRGGLRHQLGPAAGAGRRPGEAGQVGALLLHTAEERSRG